MRLKGFKRGANYKFSTIEDVVHNSNQITMDDYGNFEIGGNFLALTDEMNCIVSFVLVGMAAEGIYQCIYSDFDPQV